MARRKEAAVVKIWRRFEEEVFMDDWERALNLAEKTRFLEEAS
jgi:hypothetical protein